MLKIGIYLIDKMIFLQKLIRGQQEWQKSTKWNNCYSYFALDGLQPHRSLDQFPRVLFLIVHLSKRRFKVVLGVFTLSNLMEMNTSSAE